MSQAVRTVTRSLGLIKAMKAGVLATRKANEAAATGDTIERERTYSEDNTHLVGPGGGQDCIEAPKQSEGTAIDSPREEAKGATQDIHQMIDGMSVSDHSAPQLRSMAGTEKAEEQDLRASILRVGNVYGCAFIGPGNHI